MWNLNENNVSPWDAAGDYTDINEDNETTHDNLIGSYIPIHPKRIVQVYVFTGSERYDDFNEFTKRHYISNDDIVSIADDENRLVLFYLK